MEDGNDGRPASIEEDFDEEDVWTVLGENKEKNISLAKDASVSGGNRRLPSAPRMIPRAFGNRDAGRAFHQQSAPLKIPKSWSKIYARDGYGAHQGCWFANEEGGGGGNWEDANEEEDRLPPHEWIARKLARSRTSSFSVCEGVGRKLKGRDLCKTRNAVLTITGFLE